MKPETKEKLYILAIILLIGLAAQVYYTHHYLPQEERRIDVYYNKDRELNREIIQTIRDADKFVYFAVYTFTRTDIKDALLAAKYRGLSVRGITDKNQIESLESQEKIIKELREAGIPIYVQSHSAIMHLKTVVTEKAYASGSYNWTASATESNDEVLEVGKEESVRAKYEKVLEELFERYKNEE